MNPATKVSYTRVSDSFCKGAELGVMQGTVQLVASSNEEDHLVEPVAANIRSQIENRTCVDIQRLYKEFSTGDGVKVAVDKLNLTMYSGQITALLGHNGAGKTTTIAMLTGLIPADSGTAIIEGFDLNEDMSQIRRNLGVCPQHDVLFPTLTVEEHLIMYASFKGIRGAVAQQSVERLILSVGLTEKRKDYAMNLSGGQKRKLSVAIAFVGESRVVFLDGIFLSLLEMNLIIVPFLCFSFPLFFMTFRAHIWHGSIQSPFHVEYHKK